MIKHITGDPDDGDADQNADPMQDLLLAQKRDRSACGFQHLDLNHEPCRCRLALWCGGSKMPCILSHLRQESFQATLIVDVSRFPASPPIRCSLKMSSRQHGANFGFGDTAP